MARVRLIHWKEDEAAARIATLSRAGHDVEYAPFAPALLRAMSKAQPDAVVIDLSRLPSHGREVGLALRQRKGTRTIPLVFAGGEPAKVDKTKGVLPDATYASWRGIRGALRRAMAAPPASPVVPSSRMAGYSGTPLPKKLGIKSGMRVALLAAPEGFLETLGPLPDDVQLRGDARARRDLTLWFLTRSRELSRRIERLAAQVDDGGLWICWPKKSSPLWVEVSEPMVRAAGLAHGLVDYKICAIDADWSGLKFARRKVNNKSL